MRRLIFLVIGIIAAAYLGVMAYLYFNQRELQYFPDGEVVALSDTELVGAEVVNIDVAPGRQVGGWYIEPQPDMPVIVFFKGNAGSFSEDAYRYQKMSEEGFGVLAFDYRGFPMSRGEVTGEINEANILGDSLAVFDWLQERGEDIVIWGRSLGSAPAVYVASKRDAMAVVLESPFTAAIDVAAERYPFLPMELLMKDKFLSREWIGDVAEPIFVAHGTLDRTISVKNGRELFAMANDGRKLWIVEGGDHGSLWSDGIWEQASMFYREIMAQNQ